MGNVDSVLTLLDRINNGEGVDEVMEVVNPPSVSFLQQIPKLNKVIKSIEVKIERGEPLADRFCVEETQNFAEIRNRSCTQVLERALRTRRRYTEIIKRLEQLAKEGREDF